MQLELTAGKHERYYAPVWIPAEKVNTEEPAWRRRLQEGRGTGWVELHGVRLPAQVVTGSDGSHIVLIVPYLAAGSSAECVFLPGEHEESVAECVDNGQGRMDLLIQGNRFAQYVYDSAFAKPFWGHIAAPGTQAEITRLDLQIREHPHQRSLWFAHGDVNGVDCWNEPAGRHGRQKHLGFGRVQGGGVVAYCESGNLWTDYTGNPLLVDTRSMALYNLWEGQRLLDLSICLHASEGPVTLGPTKEAGPLGLRVAPSLSGRKGGVIRNAWGGLGEKECWGQRAPWCDYSGVVAGHQVGIAIFDHHENDRYPSYWHVREYGLMAINNFYFSGARQLAAGESITFRYRLLFHSGDAARAHVAERFHDYVHPVGIDYTTGA